MMNLKDGLKKIERLKLFDKLDFIEKVFEEKIRIGLDIGSHSVKFVQLKEGPEGVRVIKLGYKQLPQALMESRDGKDREDFMTQALRGLWQEQKIKGKSVRLAVSDPDIYLRHISVPKVAEEELAKAIKWQAEKYVSFPIDEAVVEFQTLGLNLKEDLNQMEIIIVVAKRETVNKYLGIVNHASLAPLILDICPFAVAKACLKNYTIDQERGIAIIDLGARVTSVVVLKGDSLQFVRTIDLGSNNFTQAISKGLSVDINEAEKIKRESAIFDSCSAAAGKKDIFPIIEPLLTELVKEINRSLAYCEAELFVQNIDRIILCGGGVRLEGLDKFLAQKLGLSVEMGNPFKNIAIDPVLFRTSNAEQVAPNLMPALGAALS